MDGREAGCKFGPILLLPVSLRVTWVKCEPMCPCVDSYDAKHGTDVIIRGQNFGNDDAPHGVVTLNGTECSSGLPKRLPRVTLASCLTGTRLAAWKLLQCAGNSIP